MLVSHVLDVMAGRTQNVDLDFSRLKTPSAHGDTLVEPSAAALAGLAAANHHRLSRGDFSILDASGPQVRQMVRRELGVGDDTLLIVCGHQPEFMHPGVWAKHVVADRLARAVRGAAINLVVDSDAPLDTALHVPTMENGRLTVATVHLVQVPPGFALETVGRLPRDRVEAVQEAVQRLLGDRWGRSLMPAYLGRLAEDDSGQDWVDQAVSATRAVQHRLGVQVRDVRVSRAWVGPLLGEMMVHAGRFAEAYNRALSEYRRRLRIRGRHRPIPDLAIEDPRVELPAWVYRAGERRRRLFVRPRDDLIEVFADRESLGLLERGTLSRCDSVTETLAALEQVMFRPRALALTLWARLLFADLFVQGIGGAKYDRITDSLIRDYFRVDPPGMACVSATLRLDLPRRPITPQMLDDRRHALRDLRFNPQRYLQWGEGDGELLTQREAAIARSSSLRRERPGDHRERRHTFQAIRELNRRILDSHPQIEQHLAEQVGEAEQQLRENEIADRRDFFFALHDHASLETLMERLPQVSALGL